MLTTDTERPVVVAFGEGTCYAERCGPTRGARTAIADFTGRPSPTAHPGSGAVAGRTRADPAWLQTDDGEQSCWTPWGKTRRDNGRGRLRRFGDTLPFLVKVLAAAEPLSLQAHPSAQQAVEGFGREERQGIPVSSPVRNYRDRSHKPELLVARGQFKALAGFRSGARSVELLRALRVSDLDRSSACCMTSPKRRSARAVHHLDHRAAAGPRCVGARGDRRRDPVCPFRARRDSPPKPGRCSSWASAIPATPACRPRCC